MVTNHRVSSLSGSTPGNFQDGKRPQARAAVHGSHRFQHSGETTTMKHYSINEKLCAFAEWWDDDKAWYTRAKLAEIIGCSETSLPSAFTWLRQNGYAVDNRRVFTKKVNLHRISRIDITVLNQQVTRNRSTVSKTRSLLDTRVQRTLGKNVIPIRREAA